MRPTASGIGIPLAHGHPVTVAALWAGAHEAASSNPASTGQARRPRKLHRRLRTPTSAAAPITKEGRKKEMLPNPRLMRCKPSAWPLGVPSGEGSSDGYPIATAWRELLIIVRTTANEAAATSGSA